MPGLDERDIQLARNAGKTIRQVMRVSESLEETMRKAKCPLTESQIMILRGSLMVWLPKVETGSI